MGKQIKGYITLELRDPKGKIVRKRKLKCHTFLRNFTRVCAALFHKGDEQTVYTLTNIYGTAFNVYDFSTATEKSFLDGIISANRKIRCNIGTSTQAFNRNDYNVISYLATLDYSQYEVTDDGSNVILTLAFCYLNTSGSTKEVTESCLIVYYKDQNGQVGEIALTRDVFTAELVPDGYSLGIGYQITFPW